jgi:hypothetical protein
MFTGQILIQIPATKKKRKLRKNKVAQSNMSINNMMIKILKNLKSVHQMIVVVHQIKQQPILQTLLMQMPRELMGFWA